MTKLEAVRQMLELCGLQHISALDTNGPSMAGFAERILDRENIALQEDGWHFNTRDDVELSPSLFTFDNAAWTAATKRITQTGKFTNATIGQTLTITAGTTTLGDVVVDGVDSSFNFVTVTTSINATDVASGVVGVAKNNKITLPESALNIDGIDSSDVVQLGSRLYDKETNDIFFDDSVTVTYTALIEFDCLPEAFARFVMYTAAERFAAVYASNKSTIGYIGMKLRDAEAACNRADLNSSDFNVLDSTFARDIRGQRPRRTASLGLWYGV
jgi:hypothetical protein